MLSISKLVMRFLNPIHSSLCVLIILLFIHVSCGEEEFDIEDPIITDFLPTYGIIGTEVNIYGYHFINDIFPEEGPGPFMNTSIVAFNGSDVEPEYVYQDTSGLHQITTNVPTGATSGKISITSFGSTAFSMEDFIVVQPVYESNVTVITIPIIGSWDVASDDAGNIYASNLDNYKIYKTTPDGKTFVLFNGDSDNQPLCLVADQDGSVYVGLPTKILKIKPDGATSILAGSDHPGYADGQAEEAQFQFPMDIEIDENGNIFIVEVINEKVRKIDPDGNVSTLAVNVPFKSPQGIAIGIGGDIYVADSGNDYIRKINSDGTSSIFVGSNQGYMDGADGDVQFSSPLDLAIDDLGNLYLSDAGNSIVRKVTPDKVVTTLAGSVRGYSDSEGPNAKFRHLQGIAVDKDGNILVADTGNHKIRKILIN